MAILTSALQPAAADQDSLTRRFDQSLVLDKPLIFDCAADFLSRLAAPKGPVSPSDSCVSRLGLSHLTQSEGPAASGTLVKRNENISKLQSGYLFPEIARRRKAHEDENPTAKIISLGVGDTSQPIPQSVARAMQGAAAALATPEGYRGYNDDGGQRELREALCSRYYAQHGRTANDIFISDGAKCDTARILATFGAQASIAVQDPSYPAYVDASVMLGMTGEYNGTSYNRVQYMACRPDNDFFPDLAQVNRTDLIIVCAPNNPTGATPTLAQLTELVAFAKKNGSIIVYDAVYAAFISDDHPKTIFAVPGAEECAIEVCSFSKHAGFTGVRLGWTVIPASLKFADGSSVQADFTRINTTAFEGASNIAQAGGLACLQPEGWQEMQHVVAYYKTNTSILKDAFRTLGFKVYGGENAPYVWVNFPERASWEVFNEILTHCNIIITPGVGFGPTGEGFIRASAFCHRHEILEAVQRLKAYYGQSMC